MSYGYQGYPYQQTTYSAPNYQRGYGAQAPQMFQPQPQMQPQAQEQTPYQVPLQDVRFVTSEEARAFMVYPNTRVLLIDRHSGVAHLKSADAMGQSQTQFFRFEQVNEDGTPIKPQTTSTQVNFEDFVRKSDIASLGFVTMEQYADLAQKLEQMQRRMEGAKQNGGGNKQG